MAAGDELVASGAGTGIEIDSDLTDELDRVVAAASLVGRLLREALWELDWA